MGYKFVKDADDGEIYILPDEKEALKKTPPFQLLLIIEAAIVTVSTRMIPRTTKQTIRFFLSTVITLLVAVFNCLSFWRNWNLFQTIPTAQVQKFMKNKIKTH